VPLGLLKGRVFMKFKASFSEPYAWTPSAWPPPIPELKETPVKALRSGNKVEVVENQVGKTARDSPQVPAQIVISDAEMKGGGSKMSEERAK
jgi:hypothetical protein